MISGLGYTVLLTALAAAPTAQSALPSDSLWRAYADQPIATFEGESLYANDLAGRFVLLDFWASWCAPCLAEMPTFRSLRDEYSEEDLLVIGVSVEKTSRRKLRSWLLRFDISWPQVWDGLGMEGALAKRFGVREIPRTVLLDRTGRIIAVDLRGEELRASLAVLLEPLRQAGAPSAASSR